MRSQTLQTVIAALLSFVFVLIIHRMGRRQKLSFRYTVGWLGLGGLGIIAGLMIPVAEPVAEFMKLSPSALLGAGAVSLLVVLCVQLSISISGLQEQVRTLAEEASYLRQELDEVRECKSRDVE
jgi:amino acid transporter